MEAFFDSSKSCKDLPKSMFVTPKNPTSRVFATLWEVWGHVRREWQSLRSFRLGLRRNRATFGCI